MSPEADAPKVCAKCNFKNSPQKNYCDHCGTPLSAPAPQAAGPRDIPLTVMVNKKAPAPGGFNLPMAGRVDSGLGQQAPPPPPVTGSKTEKKKTTTSGAPKRPVRFPWVQVILLTLFGGGFWQYKAYTTPARAAVRAADEYLQALSRSDFPGAYQLLSAQARAHCDTGQFQSVNTSPLAAWPGLSLARLDGDTALLALGGGTMFLIHEDGRWTVPFNSHLLVKAEDAVRRHDPDIAAISARSAVEVNPRDPVARGLLCQAYLEYRMPQEARKECALAVDLSGKFGLEPQSLPLWRRIAEER